MTDKRLEVREHCRRRLPLDGADAQALEHALTITESERDDARGERDAYMESYAFVCKDRDSLQNDVDRLKNERRDIVHLLSDYSVYGFLETEEDRDLCQKLLEVNDE